MEGLAMSIWASSGKTWALLWGPKLLPFSGRWETSLRLCVGSTLASASPTEGTTGVWDGWRSDVSSRCGVAGSAGAAAAWSIISFFRAASRSIPFFLRNTLIVVRRALLGRQSSALTGSCKQIGQAWGREDWPSRVRIHKASVSGKHYSQSSHMDWSQHGVRNALFASLLQAAQRSFTGISSIVSDLERCQLWLHPKSPPETHAAISAGVAAIVEPSLDLGEGLLRSAVGWIQVWYNDQGKKAGCSRAIFIMRAD